MSHLILPGRRIVQPQGAFEIDWGNPITKGLKAHWSLLGGGLFDVVARSIPPITGALDRKITKAGPKAQYGAADTVNLGNLSGLFGGASTWVTLSMWIDCESLSHTAYPELFQSNSWDGVNAHSATNGTLYIGVNATHRVTTSTSYISTSAGLTHILLASGADGQRLYKNGVLTHTGAGVAASVMGNTIIAPNASWRGVLDDVSLFNRALSSAEARSLYENKNQLFKPQPNRVWFDMGAALASPEITLIATVPVAAATELRHGVALDSVAAVSVSADMMLEYTSIDIDIALLATVPVTAATDLAHGVAFDGVASIPITADLAAAHGVSVAASAVIAVTAMQDLAHGVAVDGVAAITLAAQADVVVERYELRGEVRLGGVLVNRRVRAYQRSSGAMLGEVDTVVGKFALHTGFAPVECYITPIDLDAGATDWSPPTANRVLSVLALDTA